MLYNATNYSAGMSDPPNYYTITVLRLAAL